MSSITNYFHPRTEKENKDADNTKALEIGRVAAEAPAVETDKKRMRPSMSSYDNETRSKIGRYVLTHGNKKALEIS